MKLALSMTLALMFCNGCTRLIAEPDSKILSDAQALHKKISTIFYEIAQAKRVSSANPESKAAKKSLSFEPFQKEWNDILSDADLIKASSCSQPNNEDVCTIASGLSRILADDEQNFERSPSNFEARITQEQAKQQAELLIHAELYKQLAPNK